MYQVIRVNYSGTPQFAVYQHGGRRSIGHGYTRYSAEKLRDWMIERDAGYPTLARFRTGKAVYGDADFGCTSCDGGVQQHTVTSSAMYGDPCNKACCRAR